MYWKCPNHGLNYTHTYACVFVISGAKNAWSSFYLSGKLPQPKLLRHMAVENDPCSINIIVSSAQALAQIYTLNAKPKLIWSILCYMYHRWGFYCTVYWLQMMISSYIGNLMITFASNRQATPSVAIQGCSVIIRYIYQRCSTRSLCTLLGMAACLNSCCHCLVYPFKDVW